MKKIVIFIVLCASLLLTSCTGLQKVDEFDMCSIYFDEKITFKMNKIEWNPGLMNLGGAYFRTKQTKQDIIMNLESQGCTFLEEEIVKDVDFFQINHKGMWSIEFHEKDTYTQVTIYEMSFYENDNAIPFPLYGIYQDKLLDSISIYKPYEMVDSQYVYQSLVKFNQYVDMYSRLEKTENDILIQYSNTQLILSFEDQTLNVNIEFI